MELIKFQTKTPAEMARASAYRLKKEPGVHSVLITIIYDDARTDEIFTVDGLSDVMNSLS